MRYPLSLLAGLGITVAMLSLIWGLTAYHPPDRQLPQRVIRLPVAASMPATEPAEPAPAPIALPSPPTAEPPPALVEMQDAPIEPIDPLPPLPEPSQELDLRVDLPGRPLLGPKPRARPVRQPVHKAETATTPAPATVTAPRTASNNTPVDRPPSVLANPRPSYPRRARRRHQQGEVKLRFTVTPVGKVRDIEVVWSRPPGVFDREAKRALARWRFAPAMSDGEAVSTQVSQVIHFKLDR